MDKSSASSQNQKSYTARRVLLILTISVQEIMTPPPTQSMVSLDLGASRPTATPMCSTFLKILGDTMGKFVPSDKMSEVFSNLAKKIKEEESGVTPIPVGTPIRELVQTEPIPRPPSPSTALRSRTLKLEIIGTATNLEQGVEIEEGMESDEEGNSREKGETDGRKEGEILNPVGEESTGRMLEVMNVEEMESDDDRETLSERARRRSFRTQRGLDREELRSIREEAAVLAAAKKRRSRKEEKG